MIRFGGRRRRRAGGTSWAGAWLSLLGLTSGTPSGGLAVARRLDAGGALRRRNVVKMTHAIPILTLMTLGACGGRASSPNDGVDSGLTTRDSASPTGEDAPDETSSEVACFFDGLEGLDASCAVGSDCRPGQACLVATGCLCSSEGRC